MSGQSHSDASHSETLDAADNVLRSTILSTKIHKDDNKIDKALEEFQSVEASSVKEAAKEMFSDVKSQLVNFVQASEGLTKALDEVGKLHPFISVAVIPFKAALALELKRRENDKKVLALFVQMSEMMAILRPLSNIEPASREVLAQRMNDRLKKAAAVIIECSHATHEYYKMKLISKLIKGIKWEAKFTEFATTFAKFLSDFTTDLDICAVAGIQALRGTVENMDKKLSIFMKLVFTHFASTQEQELQSFIDKNGGPKEFISNDALLMGLIEKQTNLRSRSGQGSDRTGPGESSFDEGVSKLKETQKELQTDLDSILIESKQFFYAIFEEQKNQIAEVKTVIRRESDRIIDQLRAGAHDRILDRVIYDVWKEMGWKGSTKAHHLVLALRDYYTHILHPLSQKTPSSITDDTPPPSQPLNENVGGDGAKVEEIIHKPVLLTPEDASFFREFHLSRLVEAVDLDCSGFITVNEINDFTSSRPPDWSLPQWIAYWSVGFQVTLQRYSYRIRAVLSDIHSLYHDLIAGNVGVFCSAINYWAVEDIDLVIAGIHTIDANDKESEYQDPSFQDYANSFEKKLEKHLKAFAYLIDDTNTLSLVTGPGRLEEYFLPLVYLLLRNFLHVTMEGKTRRLTHSDFSHTLLSLYTLWNAAWDRITSLQGVFKVRNVPVKDELRRYSNGLYYYVIASEELDKDPSYLNMPDSNFDPLIETGDSDDDDDVGDGDDDGSTASSDLTGHSTEHNNDLEELDDGGYHTIQPPSGSFTESPSLVGQWSGYTCGVLKGFSTGPHPGDGMMHFHINAPDAQGVFKGEGSDSLADFDVYMTLEDKVITFSKKYRELNGKRFKGLMYSGKVNEALDRIEGEWSLPKAQPASDAGDALGSGTDKRSGRVAGGDTTFEQTIPGGGAVQVARPEDENPLVELDIVMGKFTVLKKPEEYFRFHPSPEELVKNKPRSLWNFAINMIMHQLSTRTMHWSALKRRRDQRRRFIELSKERSGGGLQGSKGAELKMLKRGLSIADARFYDTLVSFERGREVIHLHCSCDACGLLHLRTTRILCLDCSAGHYYGTTIDLCASCIHKSFTFAGDLGPVKRKHSPTHSLLQVRRLLVKRLRHNARDNAHSTLCNVPPDSDGEDVATICCVCGEGVKRPFWACCECPRKYVCMDCNAKIERSRPWFYEPIIKANSRGESAPQEGTPTIRAVSSVFDSEDSDGGGHEEIPKVQSHDWSHDLVLCTSPGDQVPDVTVEERMTNLEERFQGLKGSITGLEMQLQRLEGLLLQFVEGK